MFFCFSYQASQGNPIEIVELEGGSLPTSPSPQTLYLQAGAQHIHKFELQNGRLFFLGDPIFEKKEFSANTIVSETGQVNLEKLYEEVRGHYYWFFIDKYSMSCGSSFGAIFPIYYWTESEKTFVSSSSFYLSERTGSTGIDKQNILERLLFNYPLFKSTWWTEIKLLETHRYLEFSNGVFTKKGDFEISDYFGKIEDTSRKSLGRLSDLFEDEMSLFFPDDPFAISLTGGFDGRTLVALARKKRKKFLTFCYGRPGASDLTYSTSISNHLGIPHLPVILNEKYLSEKAYRSAVSFMKLTEYNGNFGRPHYVYEAQLLSEKVPYMLTGNFGSELFRALHTSGSVMTDALINIFSVNDSSWKDKINAAINEWDKYFFKKESEALIEDIDAYLSKFKGWDSNHKFYYFVFNEIFRKYFGPEVVMQSNFLNNRTPYLNLRFLRELTKTKWAGVHSKVYEKNLIKRRKGQFFYANFLKNADKDLYHLKTNKGYRPVDVLEPAKLPMLLWGVIQNKYIKKKEWDSNLDRECFFQNHKTISNEILMPDPPPFLSNLIKQSLPEIKSKTNLPFWVKFYSIAYGWSAARSVKNNLPVKLYP